MHNSKINCSVVLNRVVFLLCYIMYNNFNLQILASESECKAEHLVLIEDDEVLHFCINNPFIYIEAITSENANKIRKKYNMYNDLHKNPFYSMCLAIYIFIIEQISYRPPEAERCISIDYIEEFVIKHNLDINKINQLNAYEDISSFSLMLLCELSELIGMQDNITEIASLNLEKRENKRIERISHKLKKRFNDSNLPSMDWDIEKCEKIRDSIKENLDNYKSLNDLHIIYDNTDTLLHSIIKSFEIDEFDVRIILMGLLDENIPADVPENFPQISAGLTFLSIRHYETHIKHICDTIKYYYTYKFGPRATDLLCRNIRTTLNVKNWSKLKSFIKQRFMSIFMGGQNYNELQKLKESIKIAIDLTQELKPVHNIKKAIKTYQQMKKKERLFKRYAVDKKE